MQFIKSGAVATALLLGVALAIPVTASATDNNEVALRFVALGDAEPKPEPRFPHMAAVVKDVNRLAKKIDVDFVIGVGDMAHKGTRIQYENASSVLGELRLPFYPIMGNEEHESTVERYLRYANRWGVQKAEIKNPSYVVETDHVALVFASPDVGRDFEDRGIDWMLEQIRRLQPRPVLLIVHGAQVGAYPENPDKGITHERFAEVIAQPNLAAIISGDLHLDMDRVDHSKQIDAIHYLHIPALERTKIPDETRHTAMFRVFTVHADGEVLVETYAAGVTGPLRRHDYRFNITRHTEPSAAAIRQTGFRFRSETRQGLNADAGWAAEPNEHASVSTDTPFRLRFELEHTGNPDEEQTFQLQWRRNQGEWEHVGAENFPQPAKVMALDSRSAAGFDALSDLWRLVSGDGADLGVEHDGDSAFLQVSAPQNPVMALAIPETTWEPIELAAHVRLPQDSASGAALIFGYQGPENYKQVTVNEEGTVTLSSIDAGETTRLAERSADVAHDRWLELKVVTDGDDTIIEFDGDALAFSTRFDSPISLAPVGFRVPRDSTAQFRDILIEGDPASPRVSIMASDAFRHGAETSDLLAGSSEPFSAGAGISFADGTPAWSSAGGHGEWEWPLVIRRFADGAVTNNGGDTFEFRMADAQGRPIESARTPTVTVNVPPGQLGGTFVETPARIGPWQAANGDLYFPMEPAETDNVLMMVKSSDGGKTWREADGENRPETGDLEGFASTMTNGRIHMLHQTSDDVWYHVFNTADHPRQPDAWAIRDERLASPEEPPTQVADIAVRSDGRVVGVYGGPDRIRYRIRSAKGIWSDETLIDADVGPTLSGPMLVRGKNDVVHLAYTGDNGTAWYRRIQADGDLSPRQRLTSELGTDSEDVASILPLVYLPETDTVSIIYRLQTGLLWEQRVTTGGAMSAPAQVSDRPVVQNAVDSDQTGADAIAHGNTVHVLFIDESSRSLLHTCRVAGGEWSTPAVQIDGINAQWVRGANLRQGETGNVYGFVYDAGSDGGSGMNRYAERRLPRD